MGSRVSCWAVLHASAILHVAHPSLALLELCVCRRPLRPGLPCFCWARFQQRESQAVKSTDGGLRSSPLWITRGSCCCCWVFSGKGFNRLLVVRSVAEGPFAFKWDSFVDVTSLWESCVCGVAILDHTVFVQYNSAQDWDYIGSAPKFKVWLNCVPVMTIRV